MHLQFDSQLTRKYSSRSQIARVLTQEWIRTELPCLNCSAQPLSQTPENTRSRDFVCGECEEPYELKSKAGHYTRWVADGEYSTLLETIRTGNTPNLLLLEYDPSILAVTRLQAIHRTLLSPLAVVARKPLSAHARRAGWEGCNLDLGTVPEIGRVPIVWDGTVLPWESVQRTWAKFEFIVHASPESRGWLRDVLACVQRLPRATFSLNEVYSFESELALLHPGNQNVRPKIRQQLQVLILKGAIRRIRLGFYESVWSSQPGPDQEGPRSDEVRSCPMS